MNISQKNLEPYGGNSKIAKTHTKNLEQHCAEFLKTLKKTVVKKKEPLSKNTTENIKNVDVVTTDTQKKPIQNISMMDRVNRKRNEPVLEDLELKALNQAENIPETVRPKDIGDIVADLYCQESTEIEHPKKKQRTKKAPIKRITGINSMVGYF
jgi:tRNA A58 N-methylase Trm61